ncbi:hypothetical protein ACLH0G_05195 [Aeromonas rivipollensis]
MKIFQAPPPDIPRVAPLMLSTTTNNQGAQALGDQRDIDSYG